MRIIEGIAIVCSCVGLVLMSLLVPYGDSLFSIAVSTLALIYLVEAYLFFGWLNPFAKYQLRYSVFSNSDSSVISSSRKVLGVLTGYGLAIAILAISFKLTLYPGGDLMLNIGLYSLVIAGVWSFVGYHGTSRNNFYRSRLNRIWPVLAITLLLILVPASKQVAFFYRNNPQLVEAFKNLQEDPSNKDLQEEFRRALYSKEE